MVIMDMSILPCNYPYGCRCSACSGISRRPSQFYELELNIKGQKDLEGCIKDFLQVRMECMCVEEHVVLN